MRVLQVLWDGGGNVAPQLAIARELASRGHAVTVLGHSCQRAKAEATGAGFRAFSRAPDADASSPETDLVRDWEAKTPIGAFARGRDNLMFGPALAFARDTLDAIDSADPDVVGWDYMLMGTGMAAERAAIRSAALIHTVYPMPAKGVPPFGLGMMPAKGAPGRARDALMRPLFTQLFKPGLEAVNEARAELGLEAQSGPFDQVLGADRALVLTSPAFDFAAGFELAGRPVFTGAIVDGADRGWTSPWEPDDTRPLVLASFSTTFMDQQDLANRVAEALGELPVRGLITTGPAIDPAALPAFENVRVERFVPHAAVLPQASAAVTHAGLGTVHAALAAGVPLVCIPDGRDQNDNAARVVFHGTGVRTGRGASSRKLAGLIGDVLDDHSYRRAATRMAGSFASDGGAVRAADELEALAGG